MPFSYMWPAQLDLFDEIESRCARRRTHDAAKPLPNVFSADEQTRLHHPVRYAFGGQHRLLRHEPASLSQVAELMLSQELAPCASRGGIHDD